MRNELIKDIRMYKGMSQKQFSRWLNVHYSTIANVESNHRPVSENLADIIALKFDVSDPDFVAYRERKKNARDYFFNNYR